MIPVFHRLGEATFHEPSSKPKPKPKPKPSPPRRGGALILRVEDGVFAALVDVKIPASALEAGFRYEALKLSLIHI